MREFIVKTNFGHTYKWTPENIARDYADTAIQWQDGKTHKQLYSDIVGDEDFLTQWFNDYTRSDINYSIARAELVSVDTEEYKKFIDWCIDVHGEEK